MVNHLVLTTLSAAQRVPCLPSDTMLSETSLHNFSRRYARMCVEPTLQSLTGESFPLRSANTEDGARLDVKAQNFWDKSKQSTFFDVRIFNSHAPSNCTTSTDACYRRHECEKRRTYEQRILEVEHGTFT